MNTFKTIRDQDFGLDFGSPDKYRERKASRALVFDNEQKIALLHVAKKSFHKLPGGGADEGESIIETLKREVMEEVGCEIGNIRELGIVEEFRNKFGLHQLSYCFIADVIGGKGSPSFEQDEIDDGFEIVWLDLDDAIKTLENETGVEDYEGKFIQSRDLALLKEAKKQLSI